MESSLYDILGDTAVESNDDHYTHLTCYNENIKWTIPFENKSTFWEKYCNLIYNNNKFENNAACLAEAPTINVPIIGKLHFKYQVDDDDSIDLYGNEFLYKLCNIYQSVIEEYFEITPSNSLELEFIVCVLESVKPWFSSSDGCYHTEVLIQFPYSKIDVRSYSGLIRSRVIQLLRKGNVTKELNKTPIGDWENIIQEITADTSLMMYGSSEPGSSILELNHIWGFIDIDDFEDGPDEIDIEDAFVFSNHVDALHGSLDANLADQYPADCWIPIFLSSGYWNRLLKAKRKLHKSMSCKLSNINDVYRIDEFGKGKVTRIDETPGELAVKMLTMINYTRFLNEFYWLDIGKSLYNSFSGSDEGLKLWIAGTESAISSRDRPAFLGVDTPISDVCHDLYCSFDRSNLTHLTLAWYAREDNPEKYSEWHRNWCLNSMEAALSLTHVDVAVALYRSFWLDFSFATVSKGPGHWFYFKFHRWVEDHQAIFLKNKIINEFSKRFEVVRAKFAEKGLRSTDENFRAQNEVLLKKLSSILLKLKNDGFMNAVVRASTICFHRENFLKLINSNDKLLGVTNGILECSEKDILFRSGKPEDFVTMSTGIMYRHEFNWNTSVVKECLKWFHQVYPDEDLYDFALKFAASCLHGGSLDKIFAIWTGAGNNSKSMIVKLYGYTFGDYCIKFKPSMLSEKAANSSNASPDLARAKSTRVAFMDEPEDDVALNKGAIKRFTGGDVINCRQLYGETMDMRLTFKLVLVCNDVPPIASADNAVRERSSLFPHKSKWVDDAPEDEAEQHRQLRFKMDRRFEYKIFQLAPAFLWIATKYYHKYCQESLREPKSVTIANSEYWKNNDDFGMFIGDCIRLVKDSAGNPFKQAKLSLSALYEEFKAWFCGINPGIRIPTRKQLSNELTKRWGEAPNKIWHGIALVNDNDDDDFIDISPGTSNLDKKPLNPQTIPDIPSSMFVA